MSQRFTHPEEVGRRPPADEPPGEWDDPYEDEGPVHVLWGRVAALLLALLLVFALGRVTAPTGSPPAQVDNLREQLRDARADNAQLEEDLAAAREDAAATLDPVEPDEEAPAEEAPDEDGAAAGETENTEGDTYVVKSGDTLGS